MEASYQLPFAQNPSHHRRPPLLHTALHSDRFRNRYCFNRRRDPAPIQQQIPTANSAAAYSSPEAEAQLRLAHAPTLFLVNGGTDDAFPMRASDGYPRFVTEMERWGRYQIVNKIADADLVIQFRAATTTTVVDGTTDSPQASVYHNPYFKVTIMDPATLQPIWPITITVQTGKAKKTKEDLFALSVENATSQLKLLAGETLTKQEELAMATTASASTGSSRTGLWIVLGTVALMTAAGIITPILMQQQFQRRSRQTETGAA